MYVRNVVVYARDDTILHTLTSCQPISMTIFFK